MKRFLCKIPCMICGKLISNAGFGVYSHMMAHVRRGEAEKDGMGFKKSPNKPIQPTAKAAADRSVGQLNPERRKKMLEFMKCPKCGGEIKPSGFNGNLFCWGKCYHYLNDEEIKAAKEAAQQITQADQKIAGFNKFDKQFKNGSPKPFLFE